jgi:hypothetical protein
MHWRANSKKFKPEAVSRWLRFLASKGIRPGVPEYQRCRDMLMPIRVPLGQAPAVGGGQTPYSWEPGKEINGFMMVTGGSGSGKTEALKLIGGSLVRHGIPVITIDFHGDVIFEGQNTLYGHAPQSGGQGLNPLAIDPAALAGRGLEVKIANEVDRIGRATGRLGYKQASCLRKVITDLYREFGISDTLYSSWRAAYPNLVDIFNRLSLACEEGMEGFDKQTLRECRAKVETLSCNALFRHPWPLTVQGMLAWNMRLDCSQLGREARLLAAETVLDMLFETARATGPIPVNPRSDSERYRVFIIIDEVKVLSLGRGNTEDSRHILNVLVTEGRKYGIGLILASQMMSHFGSEVHAMVSSRLVMRRMDPREAKRVAPQMGLMPEDLVSMESPPGTAYFRSASTGGTVTLQIDRPPMPECQGLISEV